MEQAFLLTSTRTPTRTSTKTLTLTPTPIPTLEAHEWLPEDPLVILANRGGDGGSYYPYPQMFIKKLTRQEVCAFLNSIDQLGFFDHDPSTYQVDRFGRWIEKFPPPTILPAIRNTFSFLSNYMPDDFRIYQPEVLGVWVYDEIKHIQSVRTWPLEEPTLDYFLKNAQPDDTYSGLP